MHSIYQSSLLLILLFGLTAGEYLYKTEDFVDKRSKRDLHRANLTLLYEWTRLDYEFPTHLDRKHAIRDGELIYSNNVPLDVDVFYEAVKNKQTIFVTVPRFKKGIPATLNTVTNKFLDSEFKLPILAPYPDWSWHRNLTSCPKDRIVSAFRVQVDKCNRLWVVDTGRIGSKQICPPQILAFDVVFNLLVYRAEIPQNVLECNSLLITPVVDMREYCNYVFIYIADVTAFGIIVHDVKKGLTWRMESKLMYPNPHYGTITIAGDSFELMDGVFGMSISPYKYGQDRKLYFHSLASVSENWIYTSVLRNDSNYHESPDSVKKQYHTFTMKRSSQSAAEAIDDKGIMYFGLLGDTAIACWNTHTAFDPNNFSILDKNNLTLQFMSGVKIVNKNNGPQELWVNSNSIQKIRAGTMDFNNGINFRIQFVDVDRYLIFSKCLNRTMDRPLRRNQLKIRTF